MEVIPKYKRENSFFVLKVKCINPATIKRKTKKKLLFIDLVIDKWDIVGVNLKSSKSLSQSFCKL